MISHPEKILFPADGTTKGELAAYYGAIAPVMLPHLRRRPITMERFHRGIASPGFFQKDVSKGFPEWLKRVEVPNTAAQSSSDCQRRALAVVAGESKQHHHSRVAVARAESLLPGRLYFRSRSGG